MMGGFRTFSITGKVYEPRSLVISVFFHVTEKENGLFVLGEGFSSMLLLLLKLERQTRSVLVVI